MKRFLYFSAALLAIAACNWKDEMVEAEELGAIKTDFSVDCTAGSLTLEVYSDGDFTATLPADASWLKFHGQDGRIFRGSGDIEIAVDYDINRGVQRNAVISLRRGRKCQDISISQKGILSAGIEFENRSITVDAAEGSCAVKLITLCKDSDLDIELVYEGSGGWIDAVQKTNNYLSFNVIANSSTARRYATLRVTGKSDPSLSDALVICQLGAGTELQALSFEELKALAKADGENTILGDYTLEGIVSGDNLSGNGGPNLNLSASLQDNTLAARTVYLQAADGSTGVKLVFDSASDNTLRRYDHVKILLDSLTLVKHSSPEFYDITGLGAKSVLESAAGNAYDIVAKEKYIEELTDEDIYSFVTLKDCEIPIRKGPFVPIDTRHIYVINSYPMPVRDIRGGSLHLMTNLSADWQRDGLGLPEGSGDISGVIVHETCDNFEWDNAKVMAKQSEGMSPEYITGVGEIGNYQIRPFRKDEIALATDFQDGFSELLMEIRYSNKSFDNLVKNTVGNVIYSTYPAVESPASAGAVNGVLEVYEGSSAKSVGLYRDWTHLGPVNDRWEMATPSDGNGVYDYYGSSAHWEISSAAVYGLIIDNNGSSWYCSGWNTNKYWRASFSTEGLTQANFPLSVQFGAAQGLGRVVGAPRYWVAEYSLNGSGWTEFGRYTVPDFPILSNRKAWQCPGPKYVTLNLPENNALLGKAKIYVRLRPSVDKAGTPSSYDGGTIDTGQPSQLNYFAIRYNK